MEQETERRKQFEREYENKMKSAWDALREAQALPDYKIKAAVKQLPQIQQQEITMVKKWDAPQKGEDVWHTGKDFWADINPEQELQKSANEWVSEVNVGTKIIPVQIRVANGKLVDNFDKMVKEELSKITDSNADDNDDELEDWTDINADVWDRYQSPPFNKIREQPEFLGSGDPGLVVEEEFADTFQLGGNGGGGDGGDDGDDPPDNAEDKRHDDKTHDEDELTEQACEAMSKRFGE